jgi:hypothetical protein
VSALRRHPLVTFFVLAYAISWGFLPFEAVGFVAGGPFIAALIVAPLTLGWAGLRDLGSRIIRWRVRWYWYALAIGLPLAVHLANLVLNVALGAPAPRRWPSSAPRTLSSWFSRCAWSTPQMGRWARSQAGEDSLSPACRPTARRS